MNCTADEHRLSLILHAECPGISFPNCSTTRLLNYRPFTEERKAILNISFLLSGNNFEGTHRQKWESVVILHFIFDLSTQNC